MNVLQRAARKLVRVPFRLMETLETERKSELCMLSEGAQLHPSSKIDNSQNDRSAIQIGPRTHVLGNLQVVTHGGRIRIGADCFIGEGSRIWSSDAVTIGDRVLISHNVQVLDNNSHSLSAAQRHEHVRAILTTGHPADVPDVPASAVVIEDDVWIGFGAAVLKGVTVGKGAVIGGATVVTKDVPPYAVMAGNPARVVGESRP